MRGRTIDRYTNKWKGSKEYIKYGEWLAEPRSAEVFRGKKLFVRQTGDSLIATYDEGNVSNNTLHSVYPLESNTSISLYYLLGLLNSKLMNWYYKIVNYLEIGKPMAEVKGIYIKKLPIAIGTEEQNKNIEIAVAKLLELCQKRYDSKYSFINYIVRTYEPKKISDKLFEFDEMSFKDFINELKKVKVKLSAIQQKDMLQLYEFSGEEIRNANKQIKSVEKSLDLLIFNVYKISEETARRIMLT